MIVRHFIKPKLNDKELTAASGEGGKQQDSSNSYPLRLAKTNQKQPTGMRSQPCQHRHPHLIRSAPVMALTGSHMFLQCALEVQPGLRAIYGTSHLTQRRILKVQ